MTRGINTPPRLDDPRYPRTVFMLGWSKKSDPDAPIETDLRKALTPRGRGAQE